jgi:hypothetical protein
MGKVRSRPLAGEPRVPGITGASFGHHLIRWPSSVSVLSAALWMVT